MTHHNEREDALPEPTTPFDESTDLIDGSDEDLVQIERFRMPPVPSLVFLGAILLAPLMGLLFSLEIALGVLVVAMSVTTWLAWEGSSRLVPEQAGRLRMAAILNGVVALIVLVLLVVRVVA